jgi:hypothetical protein
MASNADRMGPSGIASASRVRSQTEKFKRREESSTMLDLSQRSGYLDVANLAIFAARLSWTCCLPNPSQ